MRKRKDNNAASAKGGERRTERERRDINILIIIPNVNFILFSFDRGNLWLKVRDSVDCTPKTKEKMPSG